MRRLLLVQRVVEEGVGIGGVEAHGCDLFHGSCFILHDPENRDQGLRFRVSGSHLLALPHSGCPTFCKLACLVCGTNASTLERKRARACPIGDPN